MTAAFDSIFNIRRAVARVGESDWLRWWNSSALTDAGQYAMRRIFRRTPVLSSAHVAIATARVRHDAVVPNEPLVHLFNLGEEYEGAFERWLISQKTAGSAADPLPRPNEEQKRSVAAALASVGITPADNRSEANETLLLGSLPRTVLGDATRRRRAAEQLAAAYTVSEPGRLVVPFFRLEG